MVVGGEKQHILLIEYQNQLSSTFVSKFLNLKLELRRIKKKCKTKLTLKKKLLSNLFKGINNC